MPRFTIGIPTYNRAKFLPRAIECALSQTWPDVEVIVSDNASTDATPEIVRSYGDRVRYHRNETNLGPIANFSLLPDLASGDYFSWLQDDDLLHKDFVRRAVEALESDEDIVMYTAYNVDSHSYDTFVLPYIYGPPVRMDWMRSESQVLSGMVVVPVSFFATFSMPPVTAYRTKVIRRAIKHFDTECLLYNERIVQAWAVFEGKIVVDPWAAGIFFKHAQQASRLGGSLDVEIRSREWVRCCDTLSGLLEQMPETVWKPILTDWIASLSEYDRLFILNNYLPPPKYWSQGHQLTERICNEFLNAFSSDEKIAFLAKYPPSHLTETKSLRAVFKNVCRSLAPPIAWEAMSSMNDALLRKSSNSHKA